MKSVKTWILIADARTARIVENSGPGKGIFQVKNKVFEAEEPNEYSDHEGRTYNSNSPTRHKLETPSSTSGAAHEYINTILMSLQMSHQKGEYDRLIVCAAPKTLGIILKALPKVLREITIAQIDRDLTHVPTDELAKHFENVIAV